MATTLLQTIPSERISSRFVERVPIAFVRRFHLLGLDGEDNGRLDVAMPELSCVGVMDNVAALLGLPVRPVLASVETIDAAINRAYGARQSGVEAAVEGLAGPDRLEDWSESLHDGDLLDNADRAPVIKLVNLILFEAVKRRASDVHIQPTADAVQVRLRIDGVLYDLVTPPRHLAEEMASRIKVIGRMNIAEKRLPQDGRSTVTVGDRQIDLRISSRPVRDGEYLVLRLLDKSARLYALGDLGMSDRNQDIFEQLITQPHGIILVTGPTGSGKSTTLYAALSRLNNRDKHIVTLEDPIEYHVPGVSQTQVSEQKGMTFATGLRCVLRQDPDIIMVGEIRDKETARMAVQSSLTGHLVFSTLHTNDAAGAVVRLLDLGIEPYLVASSLLGVMAQRLIRQVCPECKIASPVSPSQRRQLGLRGSDDERFDVYHGTGCDRCLQTGYYGRIGIFELLPVDETIRRLIDQRARAGDIKTAAIEAGITTLRNDAIEKVRAGRTSVEEILRVVPGD